MSPVLYIERCTSPCTVHGSGTLQKRSHQPLMSPVLYMSLEHFRSAPINHLMFCTVRESRTSENRTENKVKQKVNIRGYPGISPGHFVHCQYRNQSVSTPCTREKQSVSITQQHMGSDHCRRGQPEKRKRKKRNGHARKTRNGASDCLPFLRPGNGPFYILHKQGSKWQFSRLS